MIDKRNNTYHLFSLFYTHQITFNYNLRRITRALEEQFLKFFAPKFRNTALFDEDSPIQEGLVVSVVFDYNPDSSEIVHSPESSVRLWRRIPSYESRID